MMEDKKLYTSPQANVLELALLTVIAASDDNDFTTPDYPDGGTWTF